MQDIKQLPAMIDQSAVIHCARKDAKFLAHHLQFFKRNGPRMRSASAA